jgi:hypothetical protein
MKKIAIAAALALGLGALGVATSGPADAARVIVSPLGYAYAPGYSWPVRPKVFNGARYVACYKKVLPQRSYGAAALFAVDYCYLGDWRW